MSHKSFVLKHVIIRYYVSFLAMFVSVVQLQSWGFNLGITDVIKQTIPNAIFHDVSSGCRPHHICTYSSFHFISEATKQWDLDFLCWRRPNGTLKGRGNMARRAFNKLPRAGMWLPTRQKDQTIQLDWD